VTCH